MSSRHASGPTARPKAEANRGPRSKSEAEPSDPGRRRRPLAQSLAETGVWEWGEDRVRLGEVALRYLCNAPQAMRVPLLVAGMTIGFDR